MLRIIQNRAINFTISGVLLGISLIAVILWGLKPGLDFTGGSLLEVEFSATRPEPSALADVAQPVVGQGEVTAQPLGEKGIVLRMPAIPETKHQELVTALRGKFEQGGTVMMEKRFESIGPVIGQELQRKTLWAVVFAILGIVIYVTFAFRQVSYPVSSWKYGVCTIFALLHDVIIPVGALSILGHFANMEIGAWVVTALLTIIGFSVHDTIVVFDRIRENLSKHRQDSFEDLVNRSTNETLARSINASLTVLLTLTIAYFFGGESTRSFVLTLLIGIFFGTYSSIFIASPLLVSWHMHEAGQKRPARR